MDNTHSSPSSTPWTSAQDRLRTVYDADALKQSTLQLAEALGRHFSQMDDPQSPVLPWQDPRARVELAKRFLGEEKFYPPTEDMEKVRARFDQLLETMFSHSHRLHSPRYMGHQVPPALPLAGLIEAVAGTTNQPMAVYEMGPWATAAERAVGDLLLEKVGWNPTLSASVVTHGGSLANFTALLSARNKHFPQCWTLGLDSTPGHRPAILASPDAHYCIKRSAGMLGLGTDQVWELPLDHRRRVDATRIESVLKQARDAGHQVFALVAAATNTATGAIDPLDKIADVAEKYNLWFHVDGAHGASLLMSPTHRDKIKGIERADSITWDAHKMMHMPALVTFLLYQHREDSYQAFQQDAPYLFDPANPGLAEFDGALRTVECTKRAMTLGLWTCWSLHGPQLFADLIDVSLGQAQAFYQLLCEAPDFEPAHVPQTNIQCFRYTPTSWKDKPLDEQNQWHLALRRRLIESGKFYTASTELEGQVVFRCTLINPKTTVDDMALLLQTLRELARTL